MLARIVVAGIGILLLLLFLFWPGGHAFTFCAWALACVGVMEMRAAMKRGGEAVEPVWPLLGVTLIVGTGGRLIDPAVAVAGLVALFLAVMTRYALWGSMSTVRHTTQWLLLTAYSGLWAVPAALRFQGGGVPVFSRTMEAGTAWVLVAFLIVWVTDSGAYFVGRAWGRRKLSPRLSPSKTWEGAVGGWLFATVVGLGLGVWGQGTYFGNAVDGLLLGTFGGVWAQVGDLVESSMKRELGVKDFGGWLPGHGGVLDRFDSFLFVCPLVYFWAHFLSENLGP
jgi:phosphatidate cytidylyltransferase